MDGRAALRWSVCLLIAAAGCQTQVMNVPNSGSASSGGKSTIDPAQIKKASPKFKDLPPPILVSYGNFQAGEAFSPATAPERRQQFCESARANYEKALKTDPKCVAAYQGLAHLYASMQEYPLAVENYQKALKIAPNNAALLYELGLCHNRQKNWGPALECLDRAAKIEPKNRSYADALAVVLAESGRVEDSLKCFVRSSGEAMGYYRLAQTLRRLQQPEMSRRYLEVAVRKDPSLAMELVTWNENPVPANPSPAIQQTAYQAPAPSLPSAAPESTVRKAPPQVASPAAPAPVPRPLLPSQVTLPPPPPISGE